MNKCNRFLTTTATLIFAQLPFLGSQSAHAMGAADIYNDTIVSTEALVSMNIDHLKPMFSSSGWGVERDNNGDLLLFPGGANVITETQVASVETHREIPAEQPAGFGNAEISQLSYYLQPGGWQVEPDHQGGVFLYPGSPAATAPAYRMDIAVIEVQTPAPHQNAGFDNHSIDLLANWLEPRGWKVESDSQGHALLFPQGEPQNPMQQDLASVEIISKTSNVGSATSAPDGFRQLQNHLEPHGWRVRADFDGSVLLFPRIY